MADLPTPQSFEQLLGTALSTYAAKQGIDDFNVGSAVTSFFETVALLVARSSGDIFQILRDYSIDRATGDALQRLAQEYGVIPETAQPSSGLVDIIDKSFTKVSTKIYAGVNPPNAGAVQIPVSSNVGFTSTGAIYLGRGTANIEGPISYTSIVAQGSYFLVNLAAPTAKFHNSGETITLAQGGNRTVSANTIVTSPTAGSNVTVQFSTLAVATILDGETEVDNVQVTALNPGSSGNVPAGNINTFASSPFTGATVTNPVAFTNGQDTETDDQLRVRIKRTLSSIGLGTATAVQAAIIGATSTDEQATIVSTSIISDTVTGAATIYIDSGDGYEEKFQGVGLESIVDSAQGGEQYFQLATGGNQAPVAKAFLLSNLSTPFDLIGGDTLAIDVGGVTYQHVFANSDFQSPGGATAYEVTASVNANTTLGFEALTSDDGTLVLFRAKAETNDSLQVAAITTSGRDASVQLGLPSNEVETLRLYKNDIPLTKDGALAAVFTEDQTVWSNTLSSGETLIVTVDKTQPITYTITDADFVATGLYSSLAKDNSLASWAEVFNSKLTGVTASVVGEQLQLISNLGTETRAEISIDPSSTLVAKKMFSESLGLSATGKTSDFTLSRNTAQFELAVPLVSGDKLAAGSSNTDANLESSSIEGGSIELNSAAHIWILLDDASASLVPTGLVGNAAVVVTTTSPNLVTYTVSSVATAFENVELGDYAIIWCPEMNAGNQLEGRVHAQTNNSITLKVTAAEYAAASSQTISYSQGIAIVRTNFTPQRFEVPSGNSTLDAIAAELNDQTESLVFSVLKENFLVVTNQSKNLNSALLIVTADSEGQALNFTAGQSSQGETALTAFYDSGSAQAQLPLFIHSTFSSEASATPPDSYINSINTTVDLAGRDPNELIAFLNPYGSANDAQAFNENVQETSISGNTIGLANSDLLKRIRNADRFYVASPFDFGHADSAVVVLDNNPVTETYTLPFFRRSITNTTNVNNNQTFNAYDVDSGATAQFVTSFGDFDFSNFKALMQAKKVLKPAAAQTAILYRATRWGRSGEYIDVGYAYPGAANQALASVVTVAERVKILINLVSGASIPSSITTTTGWNVSVTPNTPSAGIDQVTYTWNSQGTNPAMTVTAGQYVNISTSTGFNPANTGIFKISSQAGFTPTSTSFTVQRPTGAAVAESNIATIVSNGILFYTATPTTAAQVAAYVNANLLDITATLVNDGGTSGSGIIALSTYEESGFTYDSVSLLDGINWLASSDVSGSPQFTFKVPLNLPTDVGYAFNNGEEVRFSPTTIDQIYRLLSITAVTGFTTEGSIVPSERASNLELATNILGSAGSIQIVGGTANLYQIPLLDSADRIDNTIMSIAAAATASASIEANQWFRLQATNAQAKETEFGSDTTITLIANDPISNETLVKLGGRALDQRYFGKPRHHIRSQGSTFRIEPQGALACLSWNGVGTSPVFVKSSLNFNSSGGGTLNVSRALNSEYARYIILTGQGNFNELSIGDLLTVAGLPDTENNGTFLVTGVSDDGTIAEVLNPNGVNEFSTGSFNFTGNSTSGDAFTVGTTTLVAGTDFAIGINQAATQTNLAAVIGTLPNVTASSIANSVVIVATIASANVALSYSGTGVVTTSGSALGGDSYTSSTFSASSGVSEGDSVIIGAPFNSLNQGTFRVIREFNDSIWFENSNVIEEEVTLPANLISLGFSNTTGFTVDASSHTQKLLWNGSGTEPTLGNADMGDIIAFNTGFSSANQGSFMVLRSGAKLQQVTRLTTLLGSLLPTSGTGASFVIFSAANATEYTIWFNTGANTAPSAPGTTLVQVNVLTSDTAAGIAAKLATALSALSADFTVTSTGSFVYVTTTGYNVSTEASNNTVPTPFDILTIQLGQQTFVECINPSAVNQTSFTVSGSMPCQRPQVQFYEYEATIPGDFFTISGNVLGVGNAGAYKVIDVIDRDNAVVSAILSPTLYTSLNNQQTTVFVEEGVAYTGYKQVQYVVSEPGAPAQNDIVFTTNAQYEKINQSADIEMTSQNKMNFNTTIKKGLDSYNYNTGLIAEANRIIYGDPTDSTTYPGVGAAGAEIFIRGPLDLRVQLAIDIRLKTGVPYAQTVTQVRSNVSSLINSNPVGQSISISSIIATVNSISGVQAVSISAPTYNVNNDLIVLTPSQKAIIIDPTTDISVSQVGS